MCALLRSCTCCGGAFESVIIFPVMQFSPMPLGRLAVPFNHPDWIFEIKWDGFRCLAFIEDDRCRLISRKGNQFNSFPALNVALPKECKADRAVLDGEIVCLDENGVSQFSDLLFHRGEPRFYAFDLLSLNGKDHRYLPLAERKHGLRGIIPRFGERLLYAITWKPPARNCSTLYVGETSRALLPSGNMTPTYLMARPPG
jgi:ATP-dependent DNA ligase